MQPTVDDSYDAGREYVKLVAGLLKLFSMDEIDHLILDPFLVLGHKEELKGPKSKEEKYQYLLRNGKSLIALPYANEFALVPLVGESGTNNLSRDGFRTLQVVTSLLKLECDFDFEKCYVCFWCVGEYPNKPEHPIYFTWDTRTIVDTAKTVFEEQASSRSLVIHLTGKTYKFNNFLDGWMISPGTVGYT